MVRHSAQPDLLDWTPPQPVRRFEEDQVRAASLAARISKAVSAALKECGLTREDAAKAMGDYLGEKVSLAALNALASEARDDHRISVTRLMALIHVTRDPRLLQLLAEPFGWAVIDRRFLPMIELAAVQEQRDELARRAEALRRAARAGGAL